MLDHGDPVIFRGMTILQWAMPLTAVAFLTGYVIEMRRRIKQLEAKVYRLEVEEMLRSPLPD